MRLLPNKINSRILNGRIGVLFGGWGGGEPGPPAPSWSVDPSIDPASGDVGTTFTGSDGTIENGTVTSRAWLLDGASIGSGATVTPDGAGSLVFRVTATGDGGTRSKDSAAVTVSAIAPSSFIRGRTPDYDAGATGTYFVDADSGSDAGAGTVGDPFATLGHALSVVTTGETIRLRGGDSVANIVKYREGGNTLTGVDNVRIASYGTEYAELSGALRVTGFAACTSGDEPVVGPNYASIYKATVNKSDLDHSSYHALIPTENDVPLNLVQMRRDMTNPFALDEYQTFYTDTPSDGEPADDVVIGTRSKRTISSVTRGATANGSDPLGGYYGVTAIVAVNQGGTWNGTSFDGGTNYTEGTDYTLSGGSISWAPGGAEPAASSSYTVVFDNTVFDTITHPSVLENYTDAQLENCSVAVHADPNVIGVLKVASASGGVLTLEDNDKTPDFAPNGHRYALLNPLTEMKEGDWGWVDGGGSTIDLYVWPNNPATINSSIDIAAQIRLLTVTNCTGFQMDGLYVGHVSGDANNNSSAIAISGSGGQMHDLWLRNCSSNEKGYGPLHLVSCNGLKVERITMRHIQNSFGTFWQGVGSNGTNNHMLYVDAEWVSQTPVRAYGQTRLLEGWYKVANCVYGAHSNLFNFYVGCSQCAMVGLDMVTPGNGYGTNQRSSEIVVYNCNISMGTSGRGYDDQSGAGGGTAPTNPSNNYFFNNFVWPDLDRMNGPSIRLGDTTDGTNWYAYNNVVPSIAEIDAGTLLGRDYNILLDQEPVGANEEQVDPATLFYSQANRDWRTFPASLLTTKTGRDMTSEIEMLESWFPGVDLRRDDLGNTWNPATPGVGPYADWEEAADPGAATLSGLSATSPDDNIVVLTVTSDKTGGEIEYELDDGENAPVTGAQWVSETGEQTITVSNVPAGSYTASVQQVDGFENASNILTDTVTVEGEAEPGGDPTEWLVANGGYLVDPATVPSETTRITFRGKLRFASVDGLYYPFNQTSTGCDLRISNGTQISTTVEDGVGNKVLQTAVFEGVTITTATWYDIIFDVNMATETAVLTINGTPYSLPFTATGNGVFQSNREVAFLANSGGSNMVPAGTEFADLSVDFNGVERKAFSNDAATVNADVWQQGTDFTQGGA